MNPSRLASALFALAIAGCSDGDRSADAEREVARTGADPSLSGDHVDILPPDESATTPSNDLAAGVIDTPPAENYIAPNPDSAIPAALHGRWGLVAADCDSERDDTKGLVTVAADRMSFWESVAVPRTIRESSRTRIAGDFAFTGEGMTWSTPMIWSVEGNKLIRVDSDRNARLVYTRCPPGGRGLG